MMYSSKKTVLQLVALLRDFGIRHVVLSPGSRNAPLIQTFSQHADFTCHLQVDERNAAFFALGLMQQLQAPVVVCCTSGTALLNYGPAIAEAYYQRLPLIVISADRPAPWIGQMDGQTIPQPAQFAAITQSSIQIDDDDRPEALWYANRLINEALIAVTERDARPIHINIALSEPLFDYSTNTLPAVRKIHYHKTMSPKLVSDYHNAQKIMIVVGQLAPNPALNDLLHTLATQHHCVVVTEPISNQQNGAFIPNIDTCLAAHLSALTPDFHPDLVMTLGGHIVSKRLKQWLRANPPALHWHISETGEVIDLLQALSDVIAQPILPVLQALTQSPAPTKTADFCAKWQQMSRAISVPALTDAVNDINVVGHFLRALPPHSLLHIANSSAVRHVNLFPLPCEISVFCNRGTNGIDGTLSTVFGFAAATSQPVFLMIGDLSFFYNLGALWNVSDVRNVRILLLNNGGGGIFHLLPNLNQSASLTDYVAASHQTDAEKWAHAAGFAYHRLTESAHLHEQLAALTDVQHAQSMIVEVITDMAGNQTAFQHYYQSIQSKRA